MTCQPYHGTLDAVPPMGRQRIKRYESDKSLKYLNTELEYAALNNAAASADDAGTKYDRVYVYDPSRCSMAFLRPFKCVELAQTGDSIKCQSIVEATFVMHNEKSAAKCKKCATD